MATPIVYLAGSVLIFSLTISSPKPRPQHRLPAQAATLVLAYLSFSTSNQLSSPWDSIWALMMAVWISHSTSVLWIEPREHRKGINPWKIWNNPRLIRPPVDKNNQVLTLFTTYRFIKATAYILIYQYLLPLTFSPSGIAPAQPQDFNAEHTTYLRRLPHITFHETLLRVIWAILWALGPYLTLESAHAIFSILFVVMLRIDSPAEWPPLFGKISEAYNMRRFWGVFWHRLVARPYRNFGKIVSRRVLGFEPGSRGDRMCVAFAVFLLSGVAHAAAAWQLGDIFWGLDILWFVGCFAAGAIEAIVIRQVQLLFVAMGQERKWLWLKHSALARIVGFGWVFLFFFWSVPKWQYPKLFALVQGEQKLSSQP